MRVLNEPINKQNAPKFLITWDQYYRKFKKNCELIGESRCMIVKYESLILQPNNTIRRVAEFLDLKWTDDFLQHDKHVGEKIRISETEWSSDQIKKPIYKDALTNWIGKIEYEPFMVERKAPVLKQLGYDTRQDNFSYLEKT
jgi:hypothetical protein